MVGAARSSVIVNEKFTLLDTIAAHHKLEEAKDCDGVNA